MKKSVKTTEILKIVKNVKKEAGKDFKIVIAGEKQAGKKTLIEALGRHGKAENFINLNIDNQRAEYHPDFEKKGKKADLVILIIDANKQINPNIYSYYEYSRRKLKTTPLFVLNKIDLNPRIENLLNEIYTNTNVMPAKVISISARNNINIDQPLISEMIKKMKGKEIAVSRIFPRFRHESAKLIIRRTAQQNGAIGALTIIPGTDMPILTANQIKMVLQIAACYDLELTFDRAAEIFITIGGGYTFRAIARQLLDFVPGVGWIAKGAVAFSGTLVIGEAALRYFESGGAITPSVIRQSLESVASRLKSGSQ